MNDLTLLTITKVEPHASHFVKSLESLGRELGAEVVVVADGREAFYRAHAQFQQSRIVEMQSKGFLESIHDEAIDCVATKYVLRLDDDELASPAMKDWLADREYRTHDHWKFPRANLWTINTFINSLQLWPDHQTRLSVKAKAKGRTAIHAGSPYGGGHCAPVAIEHYKFIVKTRSERLQIAQGYDKISNGCGTGGMRAFSLPEDTYDDIPLAVWEGWNRCC